MSDLYRFHWLSGDVSEGYGDGPADSLNRLGYGSGALPALDYWEVLDKPNPPLPDDQSEVTKEVLEYE